MERGELIICTCCGRYHEHTPESNAYFDHNPYPSDEGYGLCMECVHHNEDPASYEKIETIASTVGYGHLAWENDEEDFQPLLIDMTTARAMVKVHDALNDDHQARFEEWIAMDRAHFGAMVEFTWEAVS